MERLRYLGVADEATYNPTVPPEATLHVDIASATLDAPTDPDLVYEGGLGRSARTRRPGFYAPIGNLVYAFDIDSIGEFLRWALGGYVFTADDPEIGLNTHEFYGSNESLLPSFTARLGKDELADATNFEHVFTGCVVGQLAIAASDNLVQVTVDVQAARDYRDDIKAIADLLLPSSYPLAFHEVTASLDSVDRSALVKSVDFAINNNAAVADGRSIGERFPRRIPFNERSTTFSLTLFWESLAELQQFWGDIDGVALTGQLDIPVIFTFNAGDDAGTWAADKTMEVTLPRSWYTQSQQQASGRSELVQTVAGRALSGDIALADAITIVDAEVYVKLINTQTDLSV
ncbi:hypothetical protein LCGC14_0932480 [marine sediment metagenome]|uniref:Uncharacterized protein n=1 Tax=marine sediment metagenome TaxID=412755 RepID=A0A0F9RU04_9ZZZZ